MFCIPVVPTPLALWTLKSNVWVKDVLYESAIISLSASVKLTIWDKAVNGKDDVHDESVCGSSFSFTYGPNIFTIWSLW